MIWGAEEIFKMNLFFPGNPFRIKTSSQNLFFPEEGPPKFFSLSIFAGPTPTSLMVVCLVWNNSMSSHIQDY